ncbi:MAG TPA: NAD(P)H-dependent oxidoreductase [Polyangia bacterium]|jgi:NAD(P)H-dependent FMN reductase|nr:NAD(P)H-dependent oxidoreductase [Polyangia bacterium]
MSDANALKIAVIIGSTRDARFGDKPARWIFDAAVARSDLQVELLDLRDFNLPFFNERASNAHVPSQSPEALRWQEKLAAFDGYIVVTAEYNRSVPASLKNALDQAYKEWNRKPMACVGYGATGASRAIEHLRLIAIELQMAPIRTGVHILGTDFYGLLRGQKSLDELAYLQPNVANMLHELAWWARALKAARQQL